MSAAPFLDDRAAAHITGRCTSVSSGTRDRGSAAVEMVLLTPLLVVLLLFVVYAGRAGQATEQVRHAADQGARAASMVSRPAWVAAARQAVETDLAQNGSPCSTTGVTVTSFSNYVTVSVTCRVERSGLGLLGLSSRVVVASSTEIIDVHRAR